ncbi:SpaA isopeptide-forming pilin-related protein [Ethanoligenens harbinense]|uniref:SpaA isopeptide-forming pilin-related protein n=1 Tax=Ethanoligenens harbinense TaxID=253239 RepID=UPI00131BEFCC|nr:SpaA isopeptide-forming pilin-related protein [Ethanoligenens harbinense]
MIKAVKRKLLSMMAVITAAAVGLTAIAPSLTAEAATIGFPIFDQITLTDTSKNLSVTVNDTGSPATLGSAANLIGTDDSVSLSYHFTIANTTTTQRVNSGDTYGFTIPSQLIMAGYAGLSNYPLKDGNGDQVATVNITPAGVGTLTFSDYVNDHSNLTGTFTFNSTFNKSNISNGTTVPVQFQVDGYAQPFTIDTVFSQSAPTNQKSGSVPDANGNITWTVRLNTSGNTIPAGSSISDPITGYQTYVPGTFKITDATKKTTVLDSGAATDSSVYTAGSTPTGLNAVTGTLAYTFANGFTDNDEYDVTYQTHITDPSQYFSGSQIGNTLTFKHAGWSDQQVTASGVTISKPNYITKTGSYGSGAVTWTIQYDNDSTPEDLHNVVITDPIPAGTTLQNVYLNGSATPLTLDSSPAAVSNGSAGYNSTGYLPAPGKYSVITTSSGKTLVYNAGEITSQQTLKLVTAIDNPNYNQVNDPGYSNTATIWAGDNGYIAGGVSSGSASVGTGVNVIQKSVLSQYDPSTHQIQWKILINKTGQTLPAGTFVSDTIPTGLSYVPGTFKLVDVTQSNSVVYDSGASGDGAVYSAGAIKYTFGSAFTDQYAITYTTVVNDPAVYANNVVNKAYPNTAVLNPNNSSNTSSSTATAYVTSNTLKKSGSYDHVNRAINWTVTVNQDKTQLDNVVVKDLLNGTGMSNFALDQSSVKATDSHGNPVSFTDDFTNGLTVNLGNISDQITITFSTKLTPDAFTYFVTNNANQTISTSNQATMTTDTWPDHTVTSNTAQVQISNTVVSKSGSTSTSSNVDYIDWSVQINQNAVQISNGVISDTLPAGLTLDTSSVKLYQQTLQTDGTYAANPTQVNQSNYSMTYDATSGNFVFTLPASITSPYLLTFRTYISSSYYNKTATFSNYVTFNGTGFTQTSNTTSGGTRYYGASGSADGTYGTITILKKDTSNTKILPGATFTMNDGYSTRTATTDSNGQANFGMLRFGTYTFTETKAPDNYQLDSTPFQVTVGSTTPTVTYTKTDTLKNGTIQFTKLGDNGTGLAGAVFTLYQADGTTPVTKNNVNVTATSNQYGQVEFDNIPYGTYVIKETATPDGYLPITIGGVQLLDSNASIDTANGNTLNLDTGTYDGTHVLAASARTDAAGGSITVTKVDQSSPSTTLTGAVFVLMQNGSQVGSPQTTGQNGVAKFTGLASGTYTLHEQTPPTDYGTAADYTFTIDGTKPLAQRNLTYTATDAKLTGTVTFKKVDGSGNGLGGAVFRLRTSGGTPVADATSSSDPATLGQVTFTGVPYGDGYTIEEVTGVRNHAMMAQPYTFSLHQPSLDLDALNTANHVSPNPFINTLKTANVWFSKTDGASALDGATFGLYTDAGMTHQIGMATSVGGKVTFGNVPYSDSPYYVQELSTPDDAHYQKAASFSFYLNDNTLGVSNGAVQLTKTNTSALSGGVSPFDANGNVADAPQGSITVRKTDAQIGSVLQSAAFQLLDANKNVLATGSTNAYGLLVFGNLRLNATGNTVFYLHELNPPADYALLTLDTQVVLNYANSKANLSNLDVTQPVGNTLKTGTIQFTKRGTGDVALQGAVYTLYTKTASGGKGSALAATDTRPNPVTSGQNGLVQFTNVPYGDYIIEETGTQSGTPAADYTVSSAEISVGLHDASGGTVTLPDVTDTLKTGSVQFTKKAADGSNLAGATFTLTGAGGYSQQVTSDQNGLVKFTDVPYGEYTLTETGAPVDYTIVAPVAVSLHDSTTNGTGSLTMHDMVDALKTGAIQFTKNGAGGPLDGVTFTLYDADGVHPIADSNGKAITAVSGQNGQAGVVRFTNIPYGNYKIWETGTPADYLPYTAAIPVSLHDGQVDADDTLQLNAVTNTLKTGTVQFTKKAADGSNLAGATFTLTSAGGYSQQVTSDQNGLVKFTDVPYGEYTLTETGAPADYTIVVPVAVSLHDSTTNGTGSLTMHDMVDALKTGTVQFTKKAADGSNLAGATFTLTGAGGYSQQVTSDQNGLVKFTDVPYGEYTLTETGAPADYTIVAPVAVSLHDSTTNGTGSLTMHDMVDALKTGTVQFTKKAADGSNLAGATFTLTGAGGYSQQVTSDKNGLVKFTDVPYGEYTLTETGAPADYTIVAPVAVSLHDSTTGGTGSLTMHDMVDALKTGTVQFTKKAADGSNLAGATFTLTGASGYSQQVTSDQSGLVKFTDVPYGEYTLTETGAPADYTIVAPVAVSLHDSTTNGTGSLTMHDMVDALKTGTVQFTKKAADGSNLAGATFTLTGAGGYSQQVTSDKNGLVKFTDVPYGEYTLTETGAPADYTIVAPVAVSLHNSTTNGTGSLTMHDMVDALKTGTIQFTKWAQNGGVLPGATFTLTGGSVSKTATSDQNGVVKFTDVPYGDYVITETGVPANYVAVSPISVSLHDGNTSIHSGTLDLGRVTDTIKTGDVVVHDGGETPGQVVTIYDQNGNPIASGVTDANGNVVFHDVPYGSYVVKIGDKIVPVALNSPTANVDLAANPYTGMTGEDLPPYAALGALMLALGGATLALKRRRKHE